MKSIKSLFIIVILIIAGYLVFIQSNLYQTTRNITPPTNPYPIDLSQISRIQIKVSTLNYTFIKPTDNWQVELPILDAIITGNRNLQLNEAINRLNMFTDLNQISLITADIRSFDQKRSDVTISFFGQTRPVMIELYQQDKNNYLFKDQTRQFWYQLRSYNLNDILDGLNRLLRTQ